MTQHPDVTHARQPTMSSVLDEILEGSSGAEGTRGAETIEQCVGQVMEVHEQRIVVQIEDKTCTARSAESCLLAPMPGDLVLVARCSGRPGSTSYVLAILERDNEEPLQIQVPGDLAIAAPNGQVTIAASQGIDLMTSNDISMMSKGVQVHADEGKISINRLNYLGRAIISEVEKVKMSVTYFDSVLTRLSQRVKRSYRQVDEIDQVRAEQIDYTAKKNLRLKGENTLMTAEKLVKMDGDQIHLG